MKDEAFENKIMSYSSYILTEKNVFKMTTQFWVNDSNFRAQRLS